MTRWLITFAIFTLTFCSTHSSHAESPNAAKLSRKRTMAYSQKIDALVGQHLKANGQKRNRPTDDSTFVRRIHLSAVGRIPNIDEVVEFLDSKDKQKRSDTIDELLDSYGYVSHQFNFLADLLRLKSKIGNNVPGEPYIRYVKDALEENKPYDQLVYELLSANGAFFDEGNGAVGYYLRDRNMPEDNMSNTVRVFLGTRLECAQCHDHPFDKWTQRQYFEMVAFTGGIKYQLEKEKDNFRKQSNKLKQKLEKSGNPIDAEMFAAVRRAVQSASAGISGSGTGLTRLPENYEGTDGDEGDIVTAKTMFDGQAIMEVSIPEVKTKNKNKKKKNNKNRNKIPNAEPIGTREAYAKWLTEVDNPRFAKVIANRLWKQAFSIGLIEPVDVIEDSTKASNPELMEYLTEVMIEIDFDMKEFLRIIYNTKSWQAQATRTDIVDPQKYNFPGPALKRMSAEQLWDSMIGLTVDDVDRRVDDKPKHRGYATGGRDLYDFYKEIKNQPFEKVLEIAQSGYVPKRQAMEEDESGKKKWKSGKNSEAKRKKQELNQFLKTIGKQINKAQKAKDWRLARKLKIERTEVVSKSRVALPNSNYRRASELPSPAPAKHLLREFGQSDRETIENANTDPAVTQVLRLMNGFVDQQIGKDVNSVLTRNALSALNDGGNQHDSIEAVYLTMLSRFPTDAEKEMWFVDFQENKKEAFTDLVWTIVNSNEFIFVR